MRNLVSLLPWIKEITDSESDYRTVGDLLEPLSHVPWEAVCVRLTCNNPQHCATDFGYILLDKEQLPTITDIIADALESNTHLIAVQELLNDYVFVRYSNFQKEQIHWLLFGDCDFCQNCDKVHDGCRNGHVILDIFEGREPSQFVTGGCNETLNVIDFNDYDIDTPGHFINDIKDADDLFDQLNGDE